MAMTRSTRLHVPLTIPGLSRRGLSVIYVGTSFPDLTHKSGIVVESRDLLHRVIVHFNDGTDAEVSQADAIVDIGDDVSLSIMAGVICNHPDVVSASAYAAPVLFHGEMVAVDHALHYRLCPPEWTHILVACIKRLHGLDGDEGEASKGGDAP